MTDPPRYSDRVTRYSADCEHCTQYWRWKPGAGAPELRKVKESVRSHRKAAGHVITEVEVKRA